MKGPVNIGWKENNRDIVNVVNKESRRKSSSPRLRPPYVRLHCSLAAPSPTKFFHSPPSVHSSPHSRSYTEIARVRQGRNDNTYIIEEVETKKGRRKNYNKKKNEKSEIHEREWARERDNESHQKKWKSVTVLCQNNSTCNATRWQWEETMKEKWFFLLLFNFKSRT